MKVFVGLTIEHYQCNWISRLPAKVFCELWHMLSTSALLCQFFWSIKFSQSIFIHFTGNFVYCYTLSDAFKCEYITNNICKSAAKALESGLKWRSFRLFPFGHVRQTSQPISNAHCIRCMSSKINAHTYIPYIVLVRIRGCVSFMR